MVYDGDCLRVERFLSTAASREDHAAGDLGFRFARIALLLLTQHPPPTHRNDGPCSASNRHKDTYLIRGIHDTSMSLLRRCNKSPLALPMLTKQATVSLFGARVPQFDASHKEVPLR